jgi:hypothetical protein
MFDLFKQNRVPGPFWALNVRVGAAACLAWELAIDWMCLKPVQTVFKQNRLNRVHCGDKKDANRGIEHKTNMYRGTASQQLHTHYAKLPFKLRAIQPKMS